MKGILERRKKEQEQRMKIGGRKRMKEKGKNVGCVIMLGLYFLYATFFKILNILFVCICMAFHIYITRITRISSASSLLFNIPNFFSSL